MAYGQFNFNDARWRRGSLSIINKKKVDFVGEFIQSMVSTINELENKLAAAEAENAKDKRVAEAEAQAKQAQEQADNAFRNLYWGFTQDDVAVAKNWWTSHTEVERKDFREKKKILPKDFHRMTYQLYPTELGVIKTVKCSCGQTLDLTKDWEFG